MKRRLHAAEVKLLELAGGAPTIDEGARIVAAELLRGIKCPPTHLEDLKQRLGIAEFRSEVALPVRGELRREGSAYVVVYEASLVRSLRRFTIAHEMGHIILGPRPHARSRDYKLERLCDRLATEILLPYETFTRLSDGVASIAGVVDVSRVFQTSVQATLIRFSEVGWTSAFELYDGQLAWVCGRAKREIERILATVRFENERLTSTLGTWTPSAHEEFIAAINCVLDSQAPQLARETVVTLDLPFQQAPATWAIEGMLLADVSRALFMLTPKPSFRRNQRFSVS